MAYPQVSAPYGFQPLNRVDGMPYAGATKLLPIEAAVSTPIFNGDVVAYALGGIVKSGVTTDSTTSAANYTFGVFVGCQYVNSLGQTVQAQYFPGYSTAVTNAYAYVVVDPMAEFKVAVTTSASAIIATTANAIGTNVAVVQGTGNTVTGDSGQSVLQPVAGSGSAAALPFRVVEVVPATATGTNAFVELVVKLNNPQIVGAAEAFNFA
ncbi:MAG: hypothetical protein KGI88_07980 [Betaproteobacteria bacterium]|nr:hypothetical protein [Betaproteobacteria bacterium]